MKLWLLTRETESTEYDAYYGYVIRAETEARAREMANERPGDEGRVWGDHSVVDCVELAADGPEEVVLSDFNAG